MCHTSEIDAAKRLFPWLARELAPRTLTAVRFNIEAFDGGLLTLDTEWDEYHALDEQGNFLVGVGGQSHSSLWKRLSGYHTYQNQSVVDALWPILDQARYIIRFNKGTLHYINGESSRDNPFVERITLYKISKGFTAIQWLDRQGNNKLEALRKRLTEIDTVISEN